jgi:hypothetical protein
MKLDTVRVKFGRIQFSQNVGIKEIGRSGRILLKSNIIEKMWKSKKHYAIHLIYVLCVQDQ